MTLTAHKAEGTVTVVRCDHGHVMAKIEPDGTVVVLYRDGCQVRIPPARVTVMLEKPL